MKPGLLIGAGVVAGMLLAGCQRQAPPRPAAPPLVAANATYLIKDPTGDMLTIRLTNGEATQPSPVQDLPGSSFKLLRSSVDHDLNRDGINDIVGVIASNYGGSSTWANLVVVLSQAAGPLPLVSVDLGNNTGVEAFSVAGDRITVQMLKLGDDDPHCCPTTKVTETFVVSGNQLKKVWGS
jgi:hypothetical protein